MNLKKSLSPDTVWVDLKAPTKTAIIEEMVDRLISVGKVTDRDAAIKALLEREEKMSTGMQNGIAIPHGKTDTVSELVTAVGIQRNGVDFNSIDKKPATIFIMTLSPMKKTGPHIQFLAEVSRVISHADAREKLLSAKTNSEIYEVLTGK